MHAAAVSKASRAVRAATVVLAVNAAAAIAEIGLGLAQAFATRNGVDVIAFETSGFFTDAFTFHYRLSLALLAVGAVGFVVWTRAAFTAARELTSAKTLLQFTPGRVVGAFFTPFVNLVRPYFAFAALNEEMDPGDVLLPELRPRPGEAAGGYRDQAALSPPPRIDAPPAPVALWWAFWVGRIPLGWVFGAAERHDAVAAIVLDPIVMGACSAVAALLAIRVVRRLDARMRERARRLNFRSELGEPA